MITPTARRIARKINEYRPGYRFAFDRDGQVVHVVYGPEPFLNTGHYSFGGFRLPVAAAQVQEAMDAQDALR